MIEFLTINLSKQFHSFWNNNKGFNFYLILYQLFIKMSLLSPTRDIYAYGNYIDKNTKSLKNYSPSSNYGGMS